MSRVTVELTPRDYSLRAPLRTASATYSVRRSVVVTLRAAGLVGAGEGAPLERFGTERYETMVAALRRAAQAWERLDPPSRLKDVDRFLAEAGELDETPAARHALESALLDLIAQKQRVPLATLLSRTSHGRAIRVAALLSSVDTPAVVEEARRALAQGYDTVKLKVAQGPLAQDVERVEAVRAALGPAPRLRVDANGAWTVAQAREALTALAPFNLELCEQPVAPEDIAGLASLRGATPVAVAADEALGPRALRERVINEEAADVLVLKPMVLGGLRRTVELGQRAAKSAVSCYVTSALEGPVGRLAALHVAVAIGDRAHAHGLGVNGLFAESARFSLLEPRDGALALLDEPGLGLTW